MDLESVAKELKTLAGRERLAATELDRAKDLMAQLKGMGMSNPEIVELTGGRWSESTAKGYTRGVRTTDPEPWKTATALFSEMLSQNLSLADVRETMTISKDIEATGSSLAEVVSFMQRLKESEVTLEQLSEAIAMSAQLDAKGTSPAEMAGFILELEHEDVDLPSFVELFRSWQEANLTAEDARSALDYKLQIEEAGFDMESLSLIAEASQKLGNPPEVLKSISVYGNLATLEGEVQAKKKQLETVSSSIEGRRQELQAAGQKLEAAQKKAAALEKELKACKDLKAIGFDGDTLRELAKSSERYGSPRNVFTAINEFADLSKIKAAHDELTNRVRQKQQMIRNLDNEYAHLKEPIELCKTLLEHKFSLESISLMNAVAERYGEPITVMKVIEIYGSLKAMQQASVQARSELVDIRGKIEIEKETHADYNARNVKILDQFEALNARAIEVGAAVGRVQEQLKDSTLAANLVKLLQNPGSANYAEYAPLVLLVLKDITIWVTLNKSKISYASLASDSLQNLIRYLGGS